MVAVGEIWEGHELLNEERGMIRHFLARQVGDKGDLVWLHVHEGAALDAGAFAEEIARLQRLSDEVPEVVRVLYGGCAAPWRGQRRPCSATRSRSSTPCAGRSSGRPRSRC